MNARTAWVTGASRGIGRGIAIALGAAGWTVWVTGRSTDRKPGAETDREIDRSTDRKPTGHLPGTVEETAAAVTAAGGHGIAVVCDHRDDDQVRAVVSRMEKLDLLVNNVWAGYERLNAGAWSEWTAPFWEQPIELWDAMFAGGVRAHYVATALCAPLLRSATRALVVTVSFTVNETAPVAYSMAKAADDRLAAATAVAFRNDGVVSVALHPGLVRTEGVMQYAEHFDFAGSQSPEGVGRAVVALAADVDLMSHNGRALLVDDLAVRYGIDVTT